MAVVASVRYESITNEYNDGARCLRNYLRYAEAVSRGDAAAAQSVTGEMMPAREAEAVAAEEGAVVRAMAEALRGRGYVVATNVGQSEFRCDLALRREGEEAYALGVLVDGEGHYRQRDVLARDVMKPRLLQAFGWRVAQVMARDWLSSPGAVLEFIERAMRGEEEPAEEVEAIAPEPAPVAPPAPIATWTRRLEFVGGSSNKFWQVTVEGRAYTIRFGRIGTEGQELRREFGDEDAAKRDAERLIREKLGKGYREKETASRK